MVFFTCKVHSRILGRATTVHFYVPEVLGADMPVLYLLHGMHGHPRSWGETTPLARVVDEQGLVVVMPDAANSFYCNMHSGERYEDFIVEELPSIVARYFPITQSREKSFLMGFSMGGYGAFKLALNHPDRYVAAASLSGCLDIIADFDEDGWDGYAEAIWGENYRDVVPNTPYDLLSVLAHYPSHEEKPFLYFCCGTEDFLYRENQSFLCHIKQSGFRFCYEEGSGTHDWQFVNRWCVPALRQILSELS